MFFKIDEVFLSKQEFTFVFIIFEYDFWIGNMIQRIKVFTSKSHCLSLSPRTHMTEITQQILQVALCIPQAHCNMYICMPFCIHAYTHRYVHIQTHKHTHTK